MIFEGSILLPGGCELFVVNESEETTIIATGGRSAKPAWLPSRAWLGSLRCEPVCCSLADHRPSTHPTEQR
jgi:hypothetical protein